MDTKGNFITDKEVMYLCDSLNYQSVQEIENKDFYLLKITDVSYDEQAPKKEALENVLSSLKMDGIYFIFLILGEKDKVDFYYGIAKDLQYKGNIDFDIVDVGKYILKPAIQGNFRGSRLKQVENEDKIEVCNKIRAMKYAGVIEGVPGANKDDEKYQGIDRLINVMYGDSYCFMVVARPLNDDSILMIQDNLYKFCDIISPVGKVNIQEGASENNSTASGETKGSSKTEGSSKSCASTSGKSNSYTNTDGNSKSGTKGTSETSSSKGTSNSTTEGTNHSKATTEGDNSSTTKTTGDSSSETNSKSTSKTENKGTSTSRTTSIEVTNRKIQDFIKFMDEVVFPRLDYGKGKGMFLTSMSVFAEEKTSLQKIKNTVAALYSGENGNKIPLHSFDIRENAKSAFRSFQLPIGKMKKAETEEEYLTHFAMHQLINDGGKTCLGNWITTNELGMIAGLPQKEVVGLSLNEEVEFGLNYAETDSDSDKIELGCLIQNGNELKNNIVYLDKEELDKHIFVTGVTGSGKTTTCQKILCSADMPFLVIEPAKTEYRIMKQNDEEVLIFTIGDNCTTPLKMNPFVFYPHESITARADMICACIEAAFDMEAAIPQIIERAIYRCYEDYGWNVITNKNMRYDNPFDGTGEAFPTMDDLVKNCNIVINEQGFDERLKNDYIGSINARLLGLQSGSKGFLLNTHTSIDFIELLNHKVVFELENIRNGAEKSLIMGFILINLSEAIREKYYEEGKIQHITLIEEAHRLLSKFIPGDNPSKRHSVEMFTDMLAEIRKYGESLVIVDQIPNKLTPDVLKNTNTKIIHRIFAADDKEAVGNTVMLNDEQKGFLSNLQSGRAIYFTSATEKAIQIKINRLYDTSEQSLSNAEIRDSVIRYYIEKYHRGLFTGLELFKEEPSIEQFYAIEKLGSGLADRYMDELLKGSFSEDILEKIQKVEKCISFEVFSDYLWKYKVCGKGYFIEIEKNGKEHFEDILKINKITRNERNLFIYGR